MKFLRVIFWFLILLFIAGVFLPQHYSVTRSVVVTGTGDKVHRLTNDLQQWPKWSPWAKLDPSIKVTLGDKTQGLGASQAWQDSSGGGRLQFTQSSPSQAISYNIWFGEAATPAISTMTYTTLNATETKVNWTIEGDVQMPVIGFYIALIMDSLIGPAFELGLKNLKGQVELAPQVTD